MIDGFYDKYMYTPMPEMHNEMIPVTVGCSYGKCLYCDLNVGKKFKVFDISDIKEYIRTRRKFYENKRFTPKKFTLLEGNALCLKADFLEQILSEIKLNFPDMKYVSTFARSDDILRKTDEELLRLKNLGLDRICVGIESGSDWVLQYHQKGVTSRQQYDALKKLEKAGIQYSVYIMLGLGGEDHSEEHILKTAEFLNKVHPFEVVVVNLVLFKNAKLVENVRLKEFKRISIRRQLEEEILLLENLKIRTIYNGTHKTKSVAITSITPDKKSQLIEVLKESLQNSEKMLNKKERKKWTRWDAE